MHSLRKFITGSILGTLLIFLLSLSSVAHAFPSAQYSDLPSITYLGEGPQTFTLQAPLKFLVKTYQNGQFLFVLKDPPTYTAAAREQVWSTNYLPSESIRLFDQGKSFGQVPAGCVVDFVQIEDNIDTRRNTFYINGNPLLVVDQGEVTYGLFTVPVAGELTFFAQDSIGLIANICTNAAPTGTNPPPTATFTQPAPTSAVPTATFTQPAPTSSVPTATFTQPAPTSAVATATPTGTQAAPVTATPTARSTSIISLPSATPTNPPPAATATSAPAPTATRQSSGGGVSSPTNTPAPSTAVTPGVIPQSGGGPGPREVAWMSLGIFSALGLLLGGWWLLLRRNR